MATNDSHTRHASHATIADYYHFVRTLVEQLIEGTFTGPISSNELSLVAEMLQTLPWSYDEFSLANRRLANVLNYLNTGEFGAARYELQLLNGMLSQPAIVRNAVRKLRA